MTDARKLIEDQYDGEFYRYRERVVREPDRGVIHELRWSLLAFALAVPCIVVWLMGR